MPAWLIGVYLLDFFCSGIQFYLSDCHTLPDSANGCVTDSKNYLSIHVRLHAFLVRSSCGECVPCQVISILSGPIRWQVLDTFKTSNGRHRIKMSGG